MGVKLQILGITVVSVRSVLASGDAPGGLPARQTLWGIVACQEGSASRHCIPGSARAQLPEDTRGFAVAFVVAFVVACVVAFVV
mgnify:CR=1 FL=1